MNKKIAISGFGRIGRAVFRRIFEKFPEIEIVAVNDLVKADVLAHLLKYDSIYGRFVKDVKISGNKLIITENSEEKIIEILSEKDPLNLPWEKLGIDVVLECSGQFTNYDGAEKHLKAGAKKVIISSPSKDPDKIPSYILGVNADEYNPEKDKIVDMSSCTTNCLAPIVKILNDSFGVQKGFMTTIHSYTNDQRILDLPHKDLRRARAAALNIIPTTTGAAKSIGKIIPELEGKIDGISLRVPTPTVSIVDFFCELNEKTTKEELNNILKEYSQKSNFYGILGVEDDPLVSSDYIGNSFSAVVDSSLTMATDNLAKIVAWYDNEWGYACRLADFANYIIQKNK